MLPWHPAEGKGPERGWKAGQCPLTKNVGRVLTNVGRVLGDYLSIASCTGKSLVTA